MSSHDTHDFNIMLTEDHSRELGHIAPKGLFLKIFLALLFLTFITVVVTRFDFGAFNIVVAMTVASCKAFLVAYFFMHLKYENKLLWIYALFPFVLLAILIGGVLTDNPFRAQPGPKGNTQATDTADVGSSEHAPRPARDAH